MCNMKRVYTATINLTKLIDTPFRADLMKFFSPANVIYVSFHINGTQRTAPEPEAGFPIGWLEVTDLEVLDVTSLLIAEDNDEITEDMWEFATLPELIQEHLRSACMDACDDNPSWVEYEDSKFEPYYNDQPEF